MKDSTDSVTKPAVLNNETEIIKPNKFKFKFRYIFIIFLGLIGIYIIISYLTNYFAWRSIDSKVSEKLKNRETMDHQDPSPSLPTPTKYPGIPNEIANVYSAIGRELNNLNQSVEVSQQNNSTMYWVNEEGFIIQSYSSPSLSITYQCPYYEDEMGKTHQSIRNKIETNLLRNGFKKISLKQLYYLDTYEKNQIKCTFPSKIECSSDKECDIDLYEHSDTPQSTPLLLTCAKTTDFSDVEPIRKQLNIYSPHYSIANQKNGYAYIDVREGCAGSYVLAHQNNGAWEEIHSGQEEPSCQIINEYRISKEVIRRCLDPNSNWDSVLNLND